MNWKFQSWLNQESIKRAVKRLFRLYQRISCWESLTEVKTQESFRKRILLWVWMFLLEFRFKNCHEKYFLHKRLFLWSVQRDLDFWWNFWGSQFLRDFHWFTQIYQTKRRLSLRIPQLSIHLLDLEPHQI